jgi:hypothetical protein
VAHAICYSPRGCERFQRAEAAGLWPYSAPVDNHVSDFPGCARYTAVKPAVQDDASSDSYSDCDENEVVPSFANPSPELAQRGGVRSVLDTDR